MNRRSPRSRTLAAGLAFLAAATMAVPAPARAADKNYYFPEVRVEVAVRKDGTFTVDEYRTFEFQGSFSWAFVAIPLQMDHAGASREVAISEVGVKDERGQPLDTEISRDGGRLTARWSYRARNERRTFHIHYLVSDGLTSYPDVTELYWKIIGDGWEKPARNVQATVVLPEPLASKDDLRVWGHGPLAGWAEVVDERTARFSTPDLAAGQYFEVRVVWPSGSVAGVPSGSSSLAAIKAEEDGFVQDTIARVRRAQADEADRAGRRAETRRKLLKLMSVWGVWQIVGPLIWLILFHRVWSSVGRDYRFGGLPDYVRDLPADRPPAIVQSLMREGRPVTTTAFTATLFDLARRRVLEIEDRNVSKKTLFGSKETVETVLTVKKDPERAETRLRPFERSLLEFVYEAGEGGPTPGSTVTIAGFEAYLKKHPQKFQSWHRDWTKAVKDECKPLGFLEPESLKARNRFYLFTLPAAILTLSPVLLILALALIPTLKRRTMDWARENEAWKGLDRFLDDFSDFREIPPEAYKLWEHYLVFGILFGNAKKILKMLPLILKDERAVAPVWYAGMGRPGALDIGGIEHMVSSLQHAATSISQASTSAAHYSSGGGGGFSGGGGGGGGGGRRRGRLNRSAGLRAAALMIAAILLVPACGGGPTREERIRGVLEEAVSRANHRDVAGLMALCAPDFADFEGRDTARTRELVGRYFDRARGIVVHLLAIRIGEEGPGGLVPVECEVSLSHGAAEVLRKLIRYAGSFYRFRFELRQEPRAGWRFASAGWEEIGPAGLFPESLDLLRELFPGF